jgi:hypothetical protein
MASAPSPTAPLAKRLLLGLLLLPLLLPPLQAKLHWLPEPALGGAFDMAPNPDLSWDDLVTNTFQTRLEKYLEDRIGFRSFLIRSRNQLLYSAFGVTQAEGIKKGKNGVLFMPNYIRAYLGQDRMEEADLRFRVQRLKSLQRDLAQRGISFLFVLAPNKARFEPENLPPHPAPLPGSIYDIFTERMHADSVHLLDCVALFDRWKHTKPYPLFPRGGTHWSGYGATLVADTLLRRLEALGGYQLPSYREVGRPSIVRSSDSLRWTDNDLNVVLNLLLRQETTPLAYRHLQFDEPRPGQTRPSVLLVSDSFGWGLMQFAPYIQKEFSPDSRVWFYNRTVYLPDSTSHPTGEEVGALDLRQQLESRRTVVIIMTEHNLAQNEFGFTDQVYRLYHPMTDADRAAIDQRAAALLKEASWEDQAKDHDLAQHLHDKAQQQYEREQMQQAANR